ncbi:hypothetical protein AK812_SmicGene5984 [Symbiodinium microadriaticum]|uniref:Uncharacterized protein n=1 Tax=Symbiodinium microadriaticum TaxID=2951 RepID=A0A1Q9ESA3_SYMMI|nr:hypothetical protein AK812_SmicGene5984 [Symbiodinium microadriaticum]
MLKSRLTDCEFDGILRNLLVEESGRPAAKLFWRPPKTHSQAKDASGAYTSPSGHGFCYTKVFDAQEAFDSMCSRFKAVMEQYEETPRFPEMLFITSLKENGIKISCQLRYFAGCCKAVEKKGPRARHKETRKAYKDASRQGVDVRAFWVRTAQIQSSGAVDL